MTTRLKLHGPVIAALTVGICLLAIAVVPPATAASVPGGAILSGEYVAAMTSAPVAKNATLHLTFALRGSGADLNSYIEQLYDPLSPIYHQWLTPDQFGAKFGASDSDLKSVGDWAKSCGMTVTRIWPNHRFISISADAANAESAMSVHLLSFHDGSAPTAAPTAATFFAPDREPTLPDAIAPKIAYVFGLTNALKAKAPRLQADGDESIGDLGSADGVAPLTQPLTPSQISTIYDLGRVQSAGYTGKGLKIGVYSPTLYYSSHITTFESAYQISAPLPIEEWPASTGRATDYAGSVEADLDVQAIMGQAPSAQIVLYESPNDGTSTADQFNQMASDDLPVESFSYSFPEAQNSQEAIESLDVIIGEMAAQGQSVVCASGDSGPFDNGGTTPSTAYPASSVYATGVGGTALPDSDNGYWYDEIAWNDQYGTTGGGNSLFFSIPSWQSAPGVQNAQSNGMRQVPDVAAIAGNPGLNIYTSDINGTNATWQAYGGTSASAPLWAAALLDFDQAFGSAQGNYSPKLYTIARNATEYASSYHDITSGSDQLFSCTPGWDYLTGLGSADFYELFLNLENSIPIHSFPHGLQMISAPYNYNGAPLSGLFDATTTLAIYDPTTAQYLISPTAPADTLQVGLGYWVDAAEPLNLIKAGTVVSTKPFKAALAAGWNMIGDPSGSAQSIAGLEVLPSGATTPVSWATAIQDGLVSGTLYTYPAGSTEYTALNATSSLQPYAGYWIDVLKACTLEFPNG